ncbi:MAG: sulfatase-like hydrolase/transferase [Nitrospirales bacterium]|nr:sulfatase-like hydrolase/transferase [Nitrospirales bacterium]
MNRLLVSHYAHPRSQPSLSLGYLLLRWCGVLMIIQQAERWFLTPSVMAVEPVTMSLLVQTFVVGFLTDVVTAIGGIGLAITLALPGSTLGLIPINHHQPERWRSGYLRWLHRTLLFVSLLFGLVGTVDIAYFRMSFHHLNFPFFEYVDDMIQASLGHIESQASHQTSAELSEAGRWLGYLMQFFLLLGTTLFFWFRGFNSRWVQSKVVWPQSHTTQFHTVLLATPFTIGAVALSPLGLPLASTLQISSATYHGLSQNPILSATLPLWDYFQSREGWTASPLARPMSATDALASAHQILGPSAQWPSLQYPLVKEQPITSTVVLSRPANVLLLFVEGLDRRFLGKDMLISNPAQQAMKLPSSIRLTPFLDALQQDSVYFEHFFSNGVQTSRGLLAALCSLFPRQGTAVIKTRNTHDYLCLPSLLQEEGYRTEMVMGLDSDIPGLRTFLTRNGIEQISGGRDFPADIERMGIGITDGALLELLARRIIELRQQPVPYFLAALTAGTHHPFSVPLRHTEVQALKAHPDPYIPALRNLDIEFSRFFHDLKRKGFLTNTLVIVLGDHGRHEPMGATEGERIVGHFLAPLFIWMDEALRLEAGIAPHIVPTVASQVDLAPTLLALMGLTPPISSFLGSDLSCRLVENCLPDHKAYLSSMYDNAIGIAGHQGIWWYAFDTGLLSHTDLNLQSPIRYPSLHEPDAIQAYRSMIGLYLTANTLLEHNRIWSWTDLGPFLHPTPLSKFLVSVPDQPSDPLNAQAPTVHKQL